MGFYPSHWETILPFNGSNFSSIQPKLTFLRFCQTKSFSSFSVTERTQIPPKLKGILVKIYASSEPCKKISKSVYIKNWKRHESTEFPEVEIRIKDKHPHPSPSLWQQERL